MNMKSPRFLLSVALLSLSTVAFAQSAATPAPSDAQKSFDQLKTLAGTWTGPVTVDPPQPEWTKDPLWVSMRVTSRGNALVHEMKKPGTPDDPSKDDPITLLYMDNDRLTSPTTAMQETARGWSPRPRPTARRWSSISSTSPAARSTGTCITRPSP